MKTWSVGALALLAVTTSFTAQAADLPVKAPPRIAAVETWTGFYIGLNVGFS